MQKSSIYPLLAALLLASAGASRLLTASASRDAGIESYHAAIRASAKLVPDHIGPWVSQEVPVPARAIKLLTPNLMISRRYNNVEDHSFAGFSIVHCADAHDMVGHFPLRCYPAAGWDLQSSRDVQLHLANRDISAMEYTFVMKPGTEDPYAHTITVFNFLLRPNGTLLPDMESLSQSIIGARGQASGAGQVQIYFMDTPITDARGINISESLLTGFRPVIDAILADIPR